jgi:hypothetical protein
MLNKLTLNANRGSRLIWELLFLAIVRINLHSQAETKQSATKKGILIFATRNFFPSKNIPSLLPASSCQEAGGGKKKKLQENLIYLRNE